MATKKSTTKVVSKPKRRSAADMRARRESDSEGCRVIKKASK